MKKILTIVLALVMMLSVVTLVACDKTETFTGEYSYTSFGHVYGAKVDVVMEGDTISNIRLYTDEETGWVGLSAALPAYGWTDETRQVWLDGVNDLMLTYVGMTKDEVKAISATIGGVNGDADSVDSAHKVAGATQSSARLVLAIQNAICAGPKTPVMTYTGEYSYESFGHTYGVKLDVTTTGCLISEVKLHSDEETGWVSLSAALPDYGWTEDNRDQWLNSVDYLLKSFNGLSADQIKAIDATIGGVKGDMDAIKDYVNVSGATQSTARVVLALQNALCGGPSGIVEEEAPAASVTADGTYTGSNKSSFADIEVSVVVASGKVTSVTIAEGSKTNTNFGHLVTTETLKGITDSFVGMTPSEVLDIKTATGDHLIAGATVSSTTVLDAVKDALTVKAD